MGWWIGVYCRDGSWLDMVPVSSCRSVRRHVHPEQRATPGSLLVRTPLQWQGPVSLLQGISRLLPDFLCCLLYKSPALHTQLYETALFCVFSCEYTHSHSPIYGFGALISIHSDIAGVSPVRDAICHLCLWSGL